MDDLIFNPNDYIERTGDIDLDELDNRYVNVVGDTMNHLNVSSIQLYEHSTISFADNTIQTTAFNQDVVNNMIEEYTNANQILSSNNIFTGTNTFNNITSFKNEVRLMDMSGTTMTSAFYQRNRRLFYSNPMTNGTHEFWNQGTQSFIISNANINMMNKPVIGVKDITFQDGTKQTTAYIPIDNNSVVGKSQVGQFFDSPFRGQGGGQPVAWWISSPDINSVNTAFHADILETGTSYLTGKNYYFKFKSIGTYRLQMAWSITRNYISTGQAMGLPSPPPYYPDPNITLPNYGGSGGSSGSTGVSVAQFTGAVYSLKLTNSLNVTNVIAENFPKTIFNIIGQTFTGTDGITNSSVSAVVNLDPTIGQTYNFRGLNITNAVPHRPNRFYIDITFTINDGDPMDLYTQIQGSVPTNTTSPYYFNVNTHTYTITRLA